MRHTALLTGGLCLLALTIPLPAAAGTYTVKQCDANGAPSPTGTDWSPWNFGGGSVTFENNCSSTRLLTVRRTGTMGGGAAGGWSLAAPAGTTITSYSIKCQKSSPTGSAFSSGTVSASVFGVIQGVPHLCGQPPGYTVATFNGTADAVTANLFCSSDSSCIWTATPLLNITDMSYTLSDGLAPTTPSAVGSLLAGGWKKGVQAVSYASSDVGGGVRRTDLNIDGPGGGTQTDFQFCSTDDGQWSRKIPCPLVGSGGLSTNTSLLSDGPHTVRLNTTDVAGNQSGSVQQTINVDNTAPAAPQQLTIAGAAGNDSGWRTHNDFDIAWTQPDQGSGSPISAYRWKLGSPPQDATDGSLVHSATPTLDDMSIAPGTSTLYVWLVDEAGNVDPDNVSTATLRFVGAPPEAASAPTTGPGDPRVGRPQIGTPASFTGDGAITTSHLWLRCASGGGDCNPLPGAGQLSYVPTCDDIGGTLVLQATATNEIGSTQRSSDPTSAVPLSDTCPLAGGQTEPATPNGDPATREAAVTARFSAVKAQTKCRVTGHRGKRKRTCRPLRPSIGESVATVADGTLVRAEGRLTSKPGRPIARARLMLEHRVKGSRGFETESSMFVTTDRLGYWAGTIPKGPSRTVRIAYRAFARDRAHAAAAELDIHVKPQILLAARRTVGLGRRLALRGRLISGPVLPDMRVTLQGRAAGKGRWSTFAAVRPGSDGTFRAFYRFRLAASRGHRFQIRALVRDAGYPYEPGSSKPVTVRVR